MTWAALDWPDLSPAFPAPQPSAQPARPDVPAEIGERVRRAEWRRGRFVPLCVLAGVALFAAGLAVYAAAPQPERTPALALALMLAGLLVATLLPALVVLLVIGPSWEQRQQHLRLLRWERERAAWLARERARYLAALTEEQRAAFRRALAEASEKDRADGGDAQRTAGG
jgi:hypothetical protein